MRTTLFLLTCILLISYGCSPNKASTDAPARGTDQTPPAPKEAALPTDADGPSKQTAEDAIPSIPETETLCQDFNCPCGETTCAKGTRCRHGACYCGDQATALDGRFYECLSGRMKCIGYRGFDLCPCGPHECSQGTICLESQGTCLCDGKPSPDFVQNDIANWVCEPGYWFCASGTKNFGIGCQCGNERCIWGSTCSEGRCRCGSSFTSADPLQYECKDGKVLCDKPDGCTCGASKRERGMECR